MASLSMMFAATSSCARCKLRFARRAPPRGCPSCGGEFAAAKPASTPVRHVWIAVFGALGTGACAVTGYTMLALCAAVATVLAFIGANTGSPNAGKAAKEETPRSRVFVPTTTGITTTLTGIARRATLEIDGPVSGKSCLVFGLHGEAGATGIDDADGGDFDLELPSGERVMISLEHAMLTKERAGMGLEVTIEPGSALASFLSERGVDTSVTTTVTLEEHMFRDGDRVTVIARELDGTVTSLGENSRPKSRVLAGDEDHPVVVRIE